MIRTTTGAAADRATTPAADAWQRSTVGWDLAFWLFLVLALLRVTSATDVSGPRRLVSLGVIVGFGLAYQLIAPEIDRGLTRRNLSYLVIVTIGTGVACAADSTLGLLLFIAYPQMWIFSGTTRNGTILASALTLSSLLGFLTAQGWSMDSLREIGPEVGVSLGFSLLMGIWISRIIDQSRDRAELIEQLEATRTELGQAHHAQGVMAERERVAREIHDTLAQGFTSIVMLAQTARAQIEDDTPTADRLDSIEDVARENLAEARALVAAFSPVALEGATLTDAVRRLAQRFGAETGVAIDVEVSGRLGQLSRDREVVLLRATQEALTNVRRHARARLVTIRLSAEESDARVEVVDDGVGFETDRPVGFGLTGMRNRVQETGGELIFSSAPGEGTRVSVRVPVAGKDAEADADMDADKDAGKDQETEDEQSTGAVTP